MSYDDKKTAIRPVYVFTSFIGISISVGANAFYIHFAVVVCLATFDVCMRVCAIYDLSTLYIISKANRRLIYGLGGGYGWGKAPTQDFTFIIFYRTYLQNTYISPPRTLKLNTQTFYYY